MSLQTIAKRVVDLCKARKNFDVMNTLYAADIVSVEPTGKATTGQAAVIEKSKQWAAANTIHGETVAGPYFHGADRFAMRIAFDVTRKDTSRRETIEEVAVYTVKNDLIVREEFFFGGDRW